MQEVVKDEDEEEEKKWGDISLELGDQLKIEDSLSIDYSR